MFDLMEAAWNRSNKKKRIIWKECDGAIHSLYILKSVLFFYILQKTVGVIPK